MAADFESKQELRRQEVEKKVQTLVSSLDQIESMKVDADTISQMCLILAIFTGVICVVLNAGKASLITLPLLVIYHNHRCLDMSPAYVLLGPVTVILSSLNWSIVWG